MPKVEFDVVKPNLHVFEDEILFGINSSDVVSVARSIDDIVRKHIGKLKVPKSDLEVAESGKSKTREKKFIVPLRDYLDAYVDRIGYVAGVTNDSAKLFGLVYLIWAQTAEDPDDIIYWNSLQRDLANPDETFDKYDKESQVYRVDRARTLEEMRRLQKELEPKIPENYAEFLVISGERSQCLADINFDSVKAKDRTAIEKAKSELVERLKEVNGPCLSFDALNILSQATRLYGDSHRLIQNYGDVLTNPIWKERLFRLDP